jgi:hypothetical protein
MRDLNSRRLDERDRSFSRTSKPSRISAKNHSAKAQVPDSPARDMLCICIFCSRLLRQAQHAQGFLRCTRLDQKTRLPFFNHPAGLGRAVDAATDNPFCQALD